MGLVYEEGRKWFEMRLAKIAVFGDQEVMTFLRLSCTGTCCFRGRMLVFIYLKGWGLRRGVGLDG